MHTLTKISAPGWEKSFRSRRDLYEHLEQCICKHCKEEHFANYHEWPANIEDLLWTPCGAEYMVEYPEDR